MSTPPPRAVLFSGQGAQKNRHGGGPRREESFRARSLSTGRRPARLAGDAITVFAEPQEAILTPDADLPTRRSTSHRRSRCWLLSSDMTGKPLRFEAAARVFHPGRIHGACGGWNLQLRGRTSFGGGTGPAHAGGLRSDDRHHGHVTGRDAGTGAGNRGGLRCRRGEFELPGPGRPFRRHEGNRESVAGSGQGARSSQGDPAHGGGRVSLPADGLEPRRSWLPYLTAAHLEAPVVPVVANYTAGGDQRRQITSRALECQVCGSVRWEESVRKLISLGVSDFVECGPRRRARRFDEKDRCQCARCVSLENRTTIS